MGTKEHILQFAIGIDEDRIVQMVEERAVRAGVVSVENAVKEKTTARNNWTPSYIEKAINERLDKFIKENKETIIEKAAERLVEKLVRTKAVKEKVAEVLDTTIG